MSAITLQELADLLGGHVSGARVLCPGPGHSAKDRALSVMPFNNCNGFKCHSFSTADTREDCVAYILSKIGPEQRAALAALGTSTPEAVRNFEEDARRSERALAIWHEAVDPRGTVVEAYLYSWRALELTPDIAGPILRYHPRCPWKDEITGKTFFTPAMIAAMREIVTPLLSFEELLAGKRAPVNKLVAIQKTRLSPLGEKIGRRMQGPAGRAAVKLDRDDTVLEGLHICEGVESGLSAQRLGFRPVWAVGSAGAIERFPVLDGVEALTIFVENDENRASQNAADACAKRWQAAGREVIYAQSLFGSDANDGLRRQS